ncbi:MAG: 2,3-dihydroxybiphenyl 1,2-dioxygenase [Candidatus Binatia bacterium]
MANIVEVIGVTHNPFLPREFRENPDSEPGIRAAYDNFMLMRKKLDEAKPDVILVVASDHLNQWFMDNMPPFLIGKAPFAKGPFPNETRIHKLSEYRTAIDVGLARRLLREGFSRGVDFSFSDEFLVDHAFTMPLELMRPEMDVPIVPVFTNTIALPIPPARRFYEVGLAIRSIIDDVPEDKRIAVIASGHTSLDVGGPKTNQSVDSEFDRQMMAWIAAGNCEAVIREATWERMFGAGNQTPGFLNFILLLGLVRGIAATYTALNTCRYAASPFMTWERVNGDAK